MKEPVNEWSQRSWKVFPGGCLGEYNLPRKLSIVLTRGQGARVYDTTGKEFVDFAMGWGSVILGHSHPGITEAVKSQVEQGSNFSYVSGPALELAEELVRAIPCAEKVRFCASGTEATMYAVQFARAFKRRDKIVKFEGAYHGANEFGAISLFPQKLVDFPMPNPTSAGITKAACDDVLIAPFNDLEMTTRIIEENASEIAAVIVEPLHRCTTPLEGFLEGLRDVTRKHDILLVFDECVTGFRLAYGGAQEYYGVIPDIAALGKALGGGYPVGAVVGRAGILDLCNEANLGHEKYVWFASTFGGNPVTAAAALATLKELRKSGTYERLFAMGDKLRNGFQSILSELGIVAQVLGDGPLCALVFTKDKVVDYRTAFRSERERARAFTLGLFRNGIFLNPMSTKLYISMAHGDEEIKIIHSMARKVLKEIF
ncbi:MAG: aspartate aminotransferase family protein [Deltaproteobacteria bacterium]|nr:aspartate aminotransferase family protein [Deltaproteobacteria bacterium]MBL7204066.1 aspartate aminotransferase family protein [Desulfobacteraceae bacterium]